MSISAVIFVYNEEDRIETILKCITWCDEIVVIDRNSTDRTLEIARKYTDKIIILDNIAFDPRDHEVWLREANCEWVFIVTASDVIHPRLAMQLRSMTGNSDFAFDVIDIPFRRYVLGLETPRSPWYSNLNSGILFRKSIARINQNTVHGAINLDTSRHYKMLESAEYAMFHLTHTSLDIMMERHLNYCSAEGRIFPDELPIWRGTTDIFRSVFKVLFKSKSYLMGWDGIALGTAYICYYMLRFLYIWEKRRSNAPKIYDQIRESINQAWITTENGKK